MALFFQTSILVILEYHISNVSSGWYCPVGKEGIEPGASDLSYQCSIPPELWEYLGACFPLEILAMFGPVLCWNINIQVCLCNDCCPLYWWCACTNMIVHRLLLHGMPYYNTVTYNEQIFLFRVSTTKFILIIKLFSGFFQTLLRFPPRTEKRAGLRSREGVWMWLLMV